MNIFKPFATPEYLFRPRQILHRLKWAISKPVFQEFETVRLPWGALFRVRPREVIGSGIWCYGIFDLVVAEAIARLLDSGDTALDIGANIGQMTSLMQHRAGPHGKVIAFEPHPELFAELTHNLRVLPEASRLAFTELHNLALSDAEGEVALDVGKAWASNRGMSRIDPEAHGPGILRVKRTTLDSSMPSAAQIQVCKIDVEGHELNVLEGASRLLQQRRIRDLVFEDFQSYPSPVHKLLLDSGFTLFALHTRVRKPLLLPAAKPGSQFRPRDGANYLATLEPRRALDRFKGYGWRALAAPVSRS